MAFRPNPKAVSFLESVLDQDRESLMSDEPPAGPVPHFGQSIPGPADAPVDEGTPIDDLPSAPRGGAPPAAGGVARKPQVLMNQRPVLGVGERDAPPPPARDEGFEDAQRRDTDNKRNSLFGMAISNFSDAFRPEGRQTGAGRGFWDRYAAGAGAAEKYKQRQAADEGMETKRKVAELKARKADPNSIESQVHAEALQQLVPGIPLQGKSSAELDNIMPLSDKLLVELAEAKRKKSEAEAKDTETKRVETGKQTAAQSAAAVNRSMIEGLYPAEVAAFQKSQPGKWEMMSSKDLDDFQKATMAERGNANSTKNAGIVANTKHDERVEDKVAKLGEKLPPDYRDFGKKYDVIMEVVRAGKGDIPGVGFFDSKKPAWLQSDEGLKLRKAADQLKIAFNHLVSGAGISDKERTLLDQATLDITNERSFLAGLESLKDLYDSKVQQVRSMYPAEVVAQYDANVARVTASSQSDKPKDGKITVTNGKEQRRIVPTDLPAAMKDGFKQVTP
jgi:hypothetical protein